MRKRLGALKLAVRIPGALAALAGLFPALVVLGFTQRFVPGLLLAIFLVRLAMPIENSARALLALAALARAAAARVMLPVRAAGRLVFEAALLPEMARTEKLRPPKPIVRPPRPAFHPQAAAMGDAMGALLLELPRVASVTVAQNGAARGRRLGALPGPTESAAFPPEAGEALRHVSIPWRRPSGMVAQDLGEWRRRG